jgi:putative ABC transport system permease protein
LPSNISPAGINNLFPAFEKKYSNPERAGNTGYKLQLVSEVHHDTESGNFLQRATSLQLINTLRLIAIFILLIACVNFINLATAQSVNRAKEVSIRKVLGGKKGQLRVQFLSETAVITISAVALSILLVFISLPFIKTVLDLPLSFHFTSSILFFLAAITIIVILVAGYYPSVVLSGFNPVNTLKSKIKAGSAKGISLRRGLVVVQFIIAQALIIGTLIIIQQMSYFQNAQMGYDKDAILNVPIPADSISRTKIDYLRTSLLQQPGIKKVSFSFTPITNDGNWYSDFKFDHSDKNTDFSANLKWADADYISVHKLTLIAGRNYSKADTVNELVVNEQLLKKLGITEPHLALNKEINFWDGRMKAPIVGVIKDFHSQALQQEISPVILGNLRSVYRTINIKTSQQNLNETIVSIQNIWTATYPDNVFEYEFLDNKLEALYKQERQLSQLYKIFAGIAIFLSCLGLYGLASFMAVQRIKEVGIRKVLGASVQSVVFLFSKEFIILIVIAFLIASPVAWYFMNEWLKDFAYRITISWPVFAIAGLGALAIALLTISVQAIKAAVANPVKSLRTE